jgi:tetratricopeptide (TPR) repeat protein/DNA-binding XRE family transcriptional regulator
MVQPNGREPAEADGFDVLLRYHREQAGLTQERLAEQAGVGARTIRAVECGQVQPRAQTVRLLADGLGLLGPARAKFHATARRSHSDPRPAPPAGPAGSLAAVVAPAQLPADVAGFAGRGRQLAALDALLADFDHGEGQGRAGAVVISAIAGTAGVGKTALAVHWAHRVRARFGDGQLYVNLHGWAQGLPLSPLQALARLLGALGVAPEAVPVDVDQAAGLYRSLLADRRVLVVLDNARDAEQVRPLVPGGPGCLVVVTSRSQLGGLVASHGARRLNLEVLTRDEAVSLLVGMLGADRVGAEPAAAAALAEVCGLLPLALRIVGARLAAHPGQSIAGWVARLRRGDRLAELAVDGDPQAAVRAAFDCSYTTLAADVRRLFRLLGLVPGPEFTVEVGAALAGVAVGRARWPLELLADAHLVEPHASGRFGLHDLLRLYARQRTEQEDSEPQRQQARNRLFGWYLHTADAAAGLLYPQMLRLPVPPAGAGPPAAGLKDRAGALAWLESERPSLIAAVQHAAVYGPRPVAWLLGDAMRGYFWEHRHMVEWLAVAHAALGAADAEGDPQAQAAAHRDLGMRYQCQGDITRATRHYSSALGLARRAGWVDGEAATLGTLGLLHTELGRLQQAADYHIQALDLYRQTGHAPGQATALGNLGDMARRMGRPEQAIDHSAKALALFRDIGAQGGQAMSLSNLGEAYRDLGRLNDAERHLNESLALARELGNRCCEVYDLSALASVHRDAGRLTPALELAEAAVTLAREIGDPAVEADALNTLGSVLLCLDRCEQAAERHRQALDLACQTNTRYPQTEALLGLAATWRRQGRHSQAIQHAEQARGLACGGRFRVLEGRMHAILATVHLDLDNCDEAAHHARQAVAVFGAAGHRLYHARALGTLGQALHRAGDAAAARLRWQEALVLLSDLSDAGAADAGQVRTLLDAG